MTRDSVALFSNAGIQHKWTDRITNLLGVCVVWRWATVVNLSEMQASDKNIGANNKRPRCFSASSNNKLHVHVQPVSYAYSIGSLKRTK